MNQENCAFCKIVNGEIKSYVVYEDKDIIAFLDINPASEGHALIATKKHYENIYDIPEGELKKIIAVAKKLALDYREKLGVKEVNLMHASGINAQQSVPHFHIHLVPRKENDGLNLWYKTDNKSKSNFEELLNKIKGVKK